LCDSILNAATKPSPISTTPGFSSRPLHDEFSARGQALQVDLARFVEAVLGSTSAENASSVMFGIASEDLQNARVFVARYAGSAAISGVTDFLC